MPSHRPDGCTCQWHSTVDAAGGPVWELHKPSPLCPHHGHHHPVGMCTCQVQAGHRVPDQQCPTHGLPPWRPAVVPGRPPGCICSRDPQNGRWTYHPQCMIHKTMADMKPVQMVPTPNAAQVMEIIQRTMTPGVDLESIAREWLNQCPAHDIGMPEYGCRCPDPNHDPRPVIASMADEIRKLRTLVEDYVAADGGVTHGFTQDGHPCCSRCSVHVRPGNVADCGGPGPCALCTLQAEVMHEGTRVTAG